MTRLEWFNSEHTALGVDLGIIKPPLFQKYLRYRAYLQFKTKEISMNSAMEKACEHANCSRSPMLKAVKFFEPVLK